MRHERIRIGTRPDFVTSHLCMWIRRHRRLNARNQSFRLRPAHIQQNPRRPTVPPPVRCIGVGAHGPSPPHDVVARIARRPGRFDDNPRVVRENTLPPPRAAGEHMHRGLRRATGCGKYSGRRPIGVGPRSRMIARLPPHGMCDHRHDHEQREQRDHGAPLAWETDIRGDRRVGRHTIINGDDPACGQECSSGA